MTSYVFLGSNVCDAKVIYEYAHQWKYLSLLTNETRKKYVYIFFYVCDSGTVSYKI